MTQVFEGASEDEAQAVIAEIQADLEGRSETLSRRKRGAMSTDMGENDTTKAMIEAAEARGDAKLASAISEVRVGFGDMRGELKALDAKLGGLPTKWTVVSAAFGAAITAVALVLASLGFANDMFTRGFTSHDVATAAATEALAKFQHISPDQQPPGK